MDEPAGEKQCSSNRHIVRFSWRAVTRNRSDGRRKNKIKCRTRTEQHVRVGTATESPGTESRSTDDNTFDTRACFKGRKTINGLAEAFVERFNSACLNTLFAVRAKHDVHVQDAREVVARTSDGRTMGTGRGPGTYASHAVARPSVSPGGRRPPRENVS